MSTPSASGKKRSQTNLMAFMSVSKKQKVGDRLTAEVMAEDGSHNFIESQGDNSDKPGSVQISAAGEKNSVFFHLDFGSFIESQHEITDDLKKNLIEKPWTPDLSFNFPCSGARNLKFQAKWLSIWKWLVYSPSKDGAFCKFCALFHFSGVGQQSLPAGKLVSVPFCNWKNAKEDFKRHEQLQYHAKCKERAVNFLATFTGEQQSIDVVLDKTLQAQIASNRQKLKSVIKTVMLCAKEGFALRGHRDTGYLDLQDEGQRGEGHFRALLRFRVDAGDEILKQHLRTAPSNATYLSWRIQNQIISSFSSIIVRKLVSQVNEAPYFSVLADETTDISGIQQMSFCVRFFENGAVKEEFLQFLPVTDATGAGLAKVILKGISDLGLNIQNLVGQGYDGASAMSGIYKGAQAVILKQCPKALYVHCSAHCLNLAISNGCEIPSIRNCMGTIEKTYNFFNYPKRQRALEAEIGALESNPRVHKLKRLCATRWIDRHDSVNTFLELIEPVLSALSTISTWDTDRSTATDAQLLFSAICRCEFLVSLLVLESVFQMSLPLSRYLQTVNLDLSLAVSSAMNVKHSLLKMRDDAEVSFSKVYQSLEDICTKLAVSISIPRTIGRQTKRVNIPADNPEDYYRRSVFIPFLDSFIASLNEKFYKHKNVLEPFQSLLCPNSEKEDELKENISKLTDFYNLSSNIHGELTLWFQTLKSLDKAPKSAVEAVALCNKHLFPVVHELLHIMATLPVTTCTPERSFSTLKLLKTYLRNTTGVERLNGLALMYIHQNISIHEEEVFDDLAKKPRRIELRLK